MKDFYTERSRLLFEIAKLTTVMNKDNKEKLQKQIFDLYKK
jgi:hypothetical protein